MHYAAINEINSRKQREKSIPQRVFYNSTSHNLRTLHTRQPLRVRHNLQHTLQPILPRKKPLLKELPLLPLKLPGRRTRNQKALCVLGQLAPDETRADDVDGPFLGFLDGNGEGGGDGGVGEVLADVV
jgi:hypothetical protein